MGAKLVCWCVRPEDDLKCYFKTLLDSTSHLSTNIPLFNQTKDHKMCL